MKKLFEKIVIKRHYLILEEKDVTKTLSVINRQSTLFINQKMAVGNCGWADETTKWFIHFDASESQWKKIKTDLKNEGLTDILEERKRLVRERIEP